MFRSHRPTRADQAQVEFNQTRSTLPLARPSTRPASAAAGWPSVTGYSLLEELGRGGMGVVYKARHLALDRDVALKMVLAGAHAAPEQLARFHAEAMAVARLQHPNIVEIFEVGESDGHPYIAFEYVGGGDLAAELDGKPQPPRAAARLVLTLADAVHFAHQQGIVHRDLKPANILLAPGPTDAAARQRAPLDARHPKIADFGLAKELDAGAGGTRSGDVVGTPAYMAPEQAGGATHRAGPACDVYSLGVMLYEMLSGRPPFERLGSPETLLAVIWEDPVPLRRLQPGVPRDLETITLKCLEKSPRRRYASAQELSNDLSRFLRHEPIAARPTPPWERGWKWARRRPTRAVASMIGALSTSVLVAAFAWFHASLAVELRETEDERRRADANLGMAQDVVDRLIAFGGSRSSASPAENDRQHKQMLGLALKFCQGLVQQNLKAAEVQERMGLARRQIADIHRLFGRYDEAQAEYREAIGLLREQLDRGVDVPRARADLADAWNHLGDLLRATGKLEEAEDAFLQSQALRTESGSLAWR